MGWLFPCPKPWGVGGVHPLGAGLTGLMSPLVSPCPPQLSRARPPSLPGRPASCCRLEPQEHHKLAATLSHPIPWAPPVPQQPSLPGFASHTCTPLPIKARIKPAPRLCLLGDRRGSPPGAMGRGGAWPVAVGWGSGLIPAPGHGAAGVGPHVHLQPCAMVLPGHQACPVQGEGAPRAGTHCGGIHSCLPPQAVPASLPQFPCRRAGWQPGQW